MQTLMLTVAVCLVAGAARLVSAEGALEQPEDAALVLWNLIKESDNPADFEGYLARYPESDYAILARNRLAPLAEAALTLSGADVRLIELALEAGGYDPGAADGTIDEWTRAALRGWQAAHGDAETGYLEVDSARQLMALGTASEADDAAFAAARDAGTVASYESYLAAHPEGRHSTEARSLQSAAAADDAAFAQAKAAATAAAYGEYLAAYPAGQHVGEASRLRDAVMRRQTDDAAFARAKSADTAAAYRSYLASYPAGRHVVEARRLRDAAVTREERQPGRTFRDCPGCPLMVVVPPGSFTMSQWWDDNHRPVVIKQPFAVGVYEVTRAEFGRFVRDTDHDMGSSCWVRIGLYEDTDHHVWEDQLGRTWSDPGFPQNARHPVACVSWADARAYVRWLSKRSGKRYRLLSEAEWEYAARAGTRTARYWGESDSHQCRNANGADEQTGFPKAVSCDDGFAHTAPVGSYTANRFGLYDVLGNVAEWTEDCWNETYAGAPTDGSAWRGGECDVRVLRGGSWSRRPRDLRSAERIGGFIGDRDFPGNRSSDVGFRVARTLSS